MKKLVNGVEVELSQSEIDEFNARAVVHEALQKELAKTRYQRDREAEYPSKDELVIALWEKMIEGRPEASDALQTKRLEVKAKYPKPEQEV